MFSKVRVHGKQPYEIALVVIFEIPLAAAGCKALSSPYPTTASTQRVLIGAGMRCYWEVRQQLGCKALSSPYPTTASTQRVLSG